ncbi:MAG: hypothetical protein WBO17_15590, partial [Sphingorhabdus sp.]
MNMLKKLLVVFAAVMIPSLTMAQSATPAPAPVAKELSAPVTAAPADGKALPALADGQVAAAPKAMDGSLPGYTPMKP